MNDAAQLKKSDEKLLKIHRKEAENDYLITFVNELKDQVDVSRTTGCCHFKYAKTKIKNNVKRYRTGPHMVAMKETIGTKYACDLGHKRD